MATLQQIIEKLETYHFECQAGPLEKCTDWQALTTRCERLSDALKASDEGLHVFLHFFATDHVDKDELQRYRAMMEQRGGTLAYLADLFRANKQALHPAQEGTT